jgi:hypothetical protein
MTDPIPARTLLEAALFATASGEYPFASSHVVAIERTPSGAELIRRADRPEARVAVEGLTVEMLADALDAAGAPRGTCEISSGHYIYPPQSRTVAESILANLPAPRPPEPDRTAALVTEFRALVDEARANHGRWELEAEVLEECIRPLCLGARVLLWPDIEDPRTSALSTPRPPEPLDDLAMQEALLEARTERDRLTAENERLRADLATFTEEPGVLARVGAEHTTYWYNQTRLLDAKLEAMTDRTAALVERLAARQCEASAWYDLPDDGVSRCMDPEYNEEEPAICAPCEARAALAATPEPAPVADGVEPVCGHKRYRGDLPCGATASDDWHKRSTWEQDPELYHPFTPPTAPDGAP